jgi:RNA polymerase sigma-70 factor (ECF subfamily)
MAAVPGPSDAQGSDDRFEALYRDSYKAIFGNVLRRADGNLDTVGDLVAEVFVVALRRQGAIPLPPQDRLWLYGVARRVLADHQRRHSRQIRLESRLRSQAAVNEATSGDDELTLVRVRAAMEQLRPADREALQLVAWDGLSHAEAAQVLGCTPNAVALRIHKAKVRLRDILSPSAMNMPDPGPGLIHALPRSSRSRI